MHAVELALVGTGADAELESPATVEIEQCCLARGLDGVPVRCHDHRRTEPDPGRVGGPPGQNLKWIGCDGHLQRVVLGRPRDREPALVGHLHHFERMALDIRHLQIRGQALHVDG